MLNLIIAKKAQVVLVSFVLCIDIFYLLVLSYISWEEIIISPECKNYSALSYQQKPIKQIGRNKIVIFHNFKTEYKTSGQGVESVGYKKDLG